MSLSEHEQNVLDQMEQDFSVAGQRTSRLLRRTGPQPGRRRKVMTTLLGVTGGFALVLAGFAANIVALAIVGLFFMIVGTLTYAAGLITGSGPAKQIPRPGQLQPPR